MELVPNAHELAIVLRGHLAAILTFACGKRNPGFLEQTAVLEELMGEAAVSVSGKRRKPLGRGFLVLPGFLVAGACTHLYLRSSQLPIRALKTLMIGNNRGLFRAAA